MSDSRGQFFDWPIKKQIQHIRRCQKNGLKCIADGDPSCLADISDHLDLWGPWLADKVEELLAEIEKLKQGSK